MIYRSFARNTNTIYRYNPLHNAGGDPIMQLETQYPQRDSRVLVSPPQFQTIHQSAQKVALRLYPANADLLTNSKVNIELYDTIDQWQPGFGLHNTITRQIMPSNWVYRKKQNGQLITWQPDVGGGIQQFSFSTKSVFDPRRWRDPIDFELQFFDQSYNGFLLKYQQQGVQDIGTLSFYSSNTHTPFKPVFFYYIDDFQWTVSSKQIDDPDNFLVDILNIQKQYDRRQVERFRVHLNPKMYSRDWTTSYWKEDKKDFCFKQQHGATYAIWDTTQIQHVQIIPHDQTFTRISCDGTKSYFDVRMSQFQENRYYMLQLKVKNRIYPIKKYFKVV